MVWSKMQKYIDSELTYMKELKDLSQQTKLENGAEKALQKNTQKI